MTSRTKKTLAVAAAVVLGVLYFGSTVLAQKAGASMNKVRRPGPYIVGEAARTLHENLFVADLHADSLLWSRDLLERGDWGHVDLPRLREGGVALQVFGVVTKVPEGMNYKGNAADSDRLTALVTAQHWPPSTWTSLLGRARYQARRLERLARRSDGKLVLVRTRNDLDELVRRRANGEDVLGGLLGLEGAHALEGDAANLDVLFGDGLRMLGLAHFFDNEISGSAHGMEKGGLTDLGRQVATRAVELGIVLDLAHASPATLRQVTANATKPVVVSHGGVRATCDSPRNLSDDELRAIARTGGVLGVGLFDGAVCGKDVQATVRTILHAVRVMGADHVALGSDYDGSITAPVDVTGLPLITEQLLERGLPEETVAKIMGGNVVRVLRATLPP